MRLVALVPRDLFEKMAFLALVAILLVGALSIRAFAAEPDEYLDSGPVVEEYEPGDEVSALLTEISAIRRSNEIFLYFVIPCSVAVLIVYLLCKWFCSTFVDSVL